MEPKFITVHTSATYPDQDIGVDEITAIHRKKNYITIGYHEVIRLDGTLEYGRKMTKQGAHVKGFNRDNIGICLVGGLDADGKPANTFSEDQLSTLRDRISFHSGVYGIKEENIKGHRDWYPDINNDGVIDRLDWLKECPCFDVKEMLREWKK